MIFQLPESVRSHVEQLDPTNDLPAYIYDLESLGRHARRIRRALPAPVELYYTVKANSDTRILQTLAPVVDGFEASSGGELAHIHGNVPSVAVAFGAPGKGTDEVRLALEIGVRRFHVESLHEISALAEEAERLGQIASILLRVNVPTFLRRAALTMGGQASPFGFDPAVMTAALELVEAHKWVELRGVHAHLASGLDADAAIDVARSVLDFARSVAIPNDAPREINLGGGMNVDYADPSATFDWERYGERLDELAGPDEQLRIEPGRAVTAYCGWYATRVLDIRRSYGETFAVVAGGTHHLRTPAAKGHSQPFAVVPVDTWSQPWMRPSVEGEPVTVTGQLCTPKDVLAGGVYLEQLRAGDVVVFALAGAYAWNISHHSFLMHPPPRFHHLGKPRGSGIATVGAAQALLQEVVQSAHTVDNRWLPTVGGWLPDDHRDGWRRPVDLTTTESREDFVRRLHRAAELAAVASPSTAISGVDDWLTPASVMWTLATAVAKALPALHVAAMTSPGGRHVVVGPTDYAVRFEPNGGELQFRLLPTATTQPLAEGSLFTSVRATIACFVSPRLADSKVVAQVAARVVGTYLVRAAQADADSAEAAAELVRHWRDALYSELDAVEIALVAVGDRAVLRCFPALCCREDLRYAGAQCAACPKPLTVSRLDRLLADLESQGLPINPTTLAIRGSEISRGRGPWKAAPVSAEIIEASSAFSD